MSSESGVFNAMDYCIGTGGRSRTDTLLRAPDFESGVSTSFTTPAWGV